MDNSAWFGGACKFYLYDDADNVSIHKRIELCNRSQKGYPHIYLNSILNVTAYCEELWKNEIMKQTRGDR